MPKGYSLLLGSIFILFVSTGRAKNYWILVDSNKNKQTTLVVTDTTAPPKSFVLKPTIGVGIGMLSYFGNVKAVNSYAQNPTTSRLGYDLVFAQKLDEHFEFNLYALFGTLGQYVRSQTYNWNFQSQITGGGVHIMYKILPTKDISPYFILGLESYEFLSTTDMRDQAGNKYYYWNDGSIRSLPQTAPNASSAAILNPDFTYETDIRSLDMTGSGKYSEQTFAIPIGIGFMIHVNKKADVTFGTTLHYTFTDHIDGLTPGVSGPLHGTVTHDKFLMTAIGFRYDLTSARRLNGLDENDDDRYTINLDASLINDTVKEYVNADTLPQSDSLIYRQYRMYMDSTGEFAKVVYDSSMIPGRASSTTRYSIEIGRYTKGVPASEMDKLLSVADVKSTMLKDSTSVYTAGDYISFQEAKKRQEELAKQGIIDTKIVYHKGDNLIVTDKPIVNSRGTAPKPANTNTSPVVVNTDKTNVSEKGLNTDKNPVTEKSTTEKTSAIDKVTNTEKASSDNSSSTEPTIYRVQLGAYQHKLSSTHIFTSVNNLIEVKTENGFYTYSAGSFTNYKEAAVYRTQLVTEGFSDAFIKAYRHGKRVALASAGATFIKPEKENLSDSVTKEQNTMDRSEITFKVQLGVFKGSPPGLMREKFKKIKGLAFEEDEHSETHYFVGPYQDYETAEKMKEKVIKEGIQGAFVVAYFKDKQIPLQQAISIMKK